MAITKAEFVKQYCAGWGMSEHIFNEVKVALPCNCNYSRCQGWAAIANTPASIKRHNDLYMLNSQGDTNHG